MSQCLRCSKLCEPTAVFCEECRSLLRFQLRQRPHLYASQQADSSTSDDPPTLPEHVGVQGDPLERITSPLPSNKVTDLTQPEMLVAQPDLVEQAVTRLNEAAHLIEQEEDQGQGPSAVGAVGPGFPGSVPVPQVHPCPPKPLTKCPQVPVSPFMSL